VRRLAACGLVAALLAGCGGGQEAAAPPPVPTGDLGPTASGQGELPRLPAPPTKRPSAAVARELASGVIGVVGIEGDVGVRPKQLLVSSDGTLQALRWSGWGDSRATGTGQLRLRDCNPNCASGGIDMVKATVELSSPRLCGRATYFDRAIVSLPGEKPPATYVRAPC
jgi:hypothetical protein